MGSSMVEQATDNRPTKVRFLAYLPKVVYGRVAEFGRRRGLKILCRNAYRFESDHGHHNTKFCMIIISVIISLLGISYRGGSPLITGRESQAGSIPAPSTTPTVANRVCGSIAR